MSAGTFVGFLVGLLVAALVLVWTLTSAAALVYALTQGNGGAALTYTWFTLAGVALCLLGGWVARRVARGRAARP